MIKVSAPGKIHLLGEHAVVYGKPALLAVVNLRVTVTLTPSPSVIASDRRERGNLYFSKLKKIVEPIVKKVLKIKTIPPYQLTISSQLPLGSGLGSSAAISAAYIGALLLHLKTKWDLNLINELTFEAEKTFHGNPSGGDNTTVVFGGTSTFQVGFASWKVDPVSIPSKLAKNFVLVNSGKPVETTDRKSVV